MIEKEEAPSAWQQKGASHNLPEGSETLVYSQQGVTMIANENMGEPSTPTPHPRRSEEDAAEKLSEFFTSDEVKEALEIAHEFVDMGTPVGVAKKCPPDCPRSGHEGGMGTMGSGYDLPVGWPQLPPSHALVNTWRPGDGLFAVMGAREKGQGVDLLDADPRNGSEGTVTGLKEGGMWPTSYARATTPSGGTHDYIKSVGVGTRDAFQPGLDLKGGYADGSSRGLAWLPPTVKRSKTTGELGAHHWIEKPDLDLLKVEGNSDDSGEEIAFLVSQARGKSSTLSRGAVTSSDSPFMQPSYGNGVPASRPEVVTRVWELRDELAKHPKGGANTLAASRAYWVGQYVGTGQIDQAHATEIMLTALQGWTYENPRDEQNMVNTITRQIAEGTKRPRGWEKSRKKEAQATPEVEDAADDLTSDLPSMDEAREELLGIHEEEKRKKRAREIARAVTREGLEEYELQEWKELLRYTGGLPVGDFNKMAAEGKRERKRAEKARRKGSVNGPSTIEPLNGRPLLEVSNDALAAEWLRESVGTGHLSGLFLRDGLVVRTPAIGEEGYIPPEEEKDEDSPAQVRPIDKSALATLMDRTFTCYRVREDKEGEEVVTYALFPKEAARGAIDLPDMLPSLRKLQSVVHVPMVRKDGSLLDQPGYDTETRILYLPEPNLNIQPVPEKPTPDQVREAVELLNYMVGEFQFVSEHDKANYFGLLLTPLLRILTPPPYKMGLITAPMKGSGKSFLSSIIRILFGGTFRAEMSENDAELKKDVTTILDTNTGSVVVFDNVTGTVRSSAFAALLTSRIFAGRRLGLNEEVSVVNDRLWLINGNNIDLGGDLVRRALWVSIDPGCPDPWERTGFKIDDLLQWAHDHRGELIHALLVMIRGWVAAGKPAKPRGSDTYGKWLEAVDGILTHAGVPGQFDARESKKQTVGRDDIEWQEFLEAIEGIFGSRTWTARALLEKVNTDPTPLLDGLLSSQKPIPIDVLPAELTDKLYRKDDSPVKLTRSLGRWLSNRDGRWAGAITVRSAGKDRTDKTLWRIERPR